MKYSILLLPLSLVFVKSSRQEIKFIETRPSVKLCISVCAISFTTQEIKFLRDSQEASPGGGGAGARSDYHSPRDSELTQRKVFFFMCFLI